jgi:two-component system nitrate/nitrite response regulator NarL
VKRSRILVADSLPIFRSGVRTLLSREKEFETLEAANLDELLFGVTESCPDVALIDLELQPLGGIAAVRRVAMEFPTRVVVWSFDPDPQTVLSAICAGACGYLHKRISSRGLVRSLHGVARGEAPLARDLAMLMIEGLHGLEQREKARDEAFNLSAREREVLGLLATGARNKQIAAQLFISEFTVKRHVQNILRKLGLPSRKAAAAFYWSAFEPLVAVSGTGVKGGPNASVGAGSGNKPW